MKPQFFGCGLFDVEVSHAITSWEMIYDVTVLGAGVEGSSTAYYLTKKAGVKKVLLLEQVAS